MRLRPQIRQPVSPDYEQKLLHEARRIMSRPKRVVRWRLAIGLASVPCAALGFFFWKGPGSAPEEKWLLVVLLVAGALSGIVAMLLTNARSLWIER